MAPSVVAEALEGWMRPFRCHFTAAVWRNVLVLVNGALLAPGRRTVTAALRVTGRGEAAGFAVYHRVLSHGHWCSRALAHRVLAALLRVAALVPDGPVVAGLDRAALGGGGSRRGGSSATRSAPAMATSSRPAACAGSASCCWHPCPGPAVSGGCPS
ncbi:MAG: transposase [Acetobacteraceae bacterium]|nr:transposase [Acetobacteraceae bacterium]